MVSAFIVRTGFNLAYSDAQSHLTIARQLLDTRSTPGLVQLGTVWLPVPHLLLAPLVLVLWLWHTGWGAAILGAVCLGVTAASLYRVMARWGAGRLGRLAAVGVVVVNPTMLYLSSTALTEPVLIACMSASLAGIATLATRRRLSSPGEAAIFCGIPAALAALCRYEGWALAVTGAVFVGVLSYRRSNGKASRTIAMMVGFIAPPLLAMSWWVGFNWVVFHQPLEFLSGEYSANAQQTGVISAGTSTQAHLAATIRTLNMAVSSSAGWVPLVVAAMGLLVVLFRPHRLLPLLFLVTSASSYLFLVVALYTGQAIIWNKATGASYAWNNRFGMASILPIALLTGAGVEALAHAARKTGIPTPGIRAVAVLCGASLMIALVAQSMWILQRPTERSLVLTEAAESWDAGTYSRHAAEWLHDHYDGGGILLDETINKNANLPQIGIPLRQFYIRADDTLFDQAVADPLGHARWIWMSSNQSDAVRQAMAPEEVRSHYRIAYRNEEITILVRTDR
ncbi:ArnT family glycosyltransferase [Propionibacterium sp.]|uniref:ArnT family glycosyltransferase n=1 Tax=Propionibacterium sp. TaxID=1977903 RepID=UPI0039E76E94